MNSLYYVNIPNNQDSVTNFTISIFSHTVTSLYLWYH